MKKLSEQLKKEIEKNHNGDIKEYIEVYNECYNALIKIKYENTQINEGLFDWVTSLSANLFGIIKKTPLGEIFGKLGTKQEDTRSKYEQALDAAAKAKYEKTIKNRETLSNLKDQLKAQAVKTKSALELNQMDLAHKQMTDAINAQIESLKKQENYWKNDNKSLFTQDELQAQLNEYNSRIEKIEGKEKSDWEKKRDTMAAILYVKDGQTGQLRLRNKDEVKEFLDKNPDIKGEFEEVFKDTKDVLDNIGETDAKELADQYCAEAQAAFETTPEALKEEKGKIDLEKGRIAAVKAIVKSEQEKHEKFDTECDEIVNGLNRIQDLDSINLPEGENSQVQGHLMDNQIANAKDGKEAAKLLKEKLKKAGVTISIDANSFTQDENSKKYSLTQDALKAINEKIKKAKETAENERQTLKEKAEEKGIKEPENGGRWEKPDAPEVSDEVAKAAAKQFYAPEKPTEEQIKEFKNGSTITSKIEALEKDTEEKEKKYNEKKEKYNTASEKLQAQISNTLTDIGRRSEDKLDPEFKEETEKAYSQHNAGASYDKDGKLGYYDKEDNWVPAPKVDPDDEESKKARKEWEKKKTIAMLNPGGKQKDAMECALNKRIKIKKGKNGVEYIEQTKKDGAWVDGGDIGREKALKIQKEHEQAQKANQIRSDIEAAFEEGDDYSKIRNEYPALKDLSDEDFDKLDSAMMDDSEDTAKDKDGNKLVKGEDGKWYKAKEDGTPDTEAGAVSDDDVEIDKKDIKNDDEDGEDFDEDDEETAKDKDGNKLVKGEDGKWYKANNDGTPDTEAGAVSDSDVKMDKKKIQNPAKIWHKRKKKNGRGTTKNYYRKNKKGEWESISPKEFRERMQNYKDKLNSKNNSQTNTNTNTDTNTDTDTQTERTEAPDFIENDFEITDKEEGETAEEAKQRNIDKLKEKYEEEKSKIENDSDLSDDEKQERMRKLDDWKENREQLIRNHTFESFINISNFLKGKLIVERFYPRDISNYLHEHLR